MTSKTESAQELYSPNQGRSIAEAAIEWAESIRWYGKAGRINKACFLAHARTALKCDSATYLLSTMDLSKLAGVEPRSALASTKRLQEAGLIELVISDTYFSEQSSPWRLKVVDQKLMANNPLFRAGSKLPSWLDYLDYLGVDSQRAVEVAEAAIEWANARIWIGRMGSTNKACFLAHAKTALECKRIIYKLPLYKLCKLAKVGYHTAMISSGDLRYAGYIEVVDKGRKKGPNFPGEAYSWRLTVGGARTAVQKESGSVHGKSGLSNSSLQKMLAGENLSCYLSKDRAETAILIRLILSGLSPDEVLTIYKENPCGGLYHDGLATNPNETGRLLLSLYLKVEAWLRFPIFLQSWNIAVIAVKWADAHHWEGEGTDGEIDKACFIAHAIETYDCRRGDYFLSERSLAESANINVGLARASNKRLQEAGFIEQLKIPYGSWRIAVENLG